MPEVVPCAVYTYESTEDGLEQDFNSLDAQFEACSAYVASQKAEGWVLSPARYDDGGVSGGTMERPGLNQLLADIEAGKVDRIVVYKIDRLTRSLSDFAKIVDRLDAANASFVSVTQSFNTATSMGRLTLNMLLSFAQFEREVTAEPIRDKIAASKKRGLWMGGNRPLGYKPEGRSLLIDEEEAKVIRLIYALYEELGSVRAVAEQLAALDHKTRVRSSSDGSAKGGKPFSRGHIYHILSNPIYAGRIRHKTQSFEGQHEAIIEADRWDKLQDRLVQNAARERTQANAANRSPLLGKLIDAIGDRLTPSHATKKGKRHRYYMSRRLVTGLRAGNEDGWRLPAETVEVGLGSLIAQQVQKPSFVLDIIKDLATSEVTSVGSAVKLLAATCAKPNASDWAHVLRQAEFGGDPLK